MTIVVVEDERELADTYARWLADDFDVRTAYSGEEALETIDEDVDLVLLDRRMPGMRGREVLEEIRGRGIDCRVAMLTAVDPDFDIIDMPFDDYLVKPVLKDDLRGLVDRLVKLSSYDAQFQESFAVASKLKLLEREKPRADLERSEEYGELEDRLRELREGIDTTLAEFDERDFETLYHDLDQDT